jgi:RNA polymerase-binding transcription factor DksA
VTPVKKPAANAKKPATAKKPAANAKKPAPAKKPGANAKKPATKGKPAGSGAPKAASLPKKAAQVKKAVPKKAAPKQTTPKKAVPKKTAPKAAPKKVTPKAAAPKTKPAVPVKAGAITKRAAPPAPARRPTVGPYAKEPKFLEEQRSLLLEERGIHSGQAVDLRAEADSLALEREPGDVQFDEESGEGGTVTVDRERNLALSAQAVLAVEEIDDALKKIERKTYGGCERCYQPIPKARLRALPFARLCVACKSGGLSRR